MNSEERLAQIEARLAGLGRFIKLNLSQQAAPLMRIASLLVLGASLYLGGWLYKKVGNLEES